jgi:hypothetical protein
VKIGSKANLSTVTALACRRDYLVTRDIWSALNQICQDLEFILVVGNPRMTRHSLLEVLVGAF